MHRASWLLLSALLLPAPALAARCTARGQPYLEGRIAGSGRPASNPVSARAGQEIEVFFVLPGTLDGKAVLFSEEPRAGRQSWQGAGCGPLAVSWRRVEPRMTHVATRAPNHDLNIYANARVFGPQHGQWLGFDKIEYVETPIVGEERPVLRVRDARPSPGARVAPREERFAGLGVMRIAASARIGERSYATPGADDAGPPLSDDPSVRYGLISDRVLRYSYRQSDGFLGLVGTFFNVPYLFGSAGEGARSQAERYQGADCADMLVAALRMAGQRNLRYSSVAGLVDSLRRVAGPVIVAPRVEGQNENKTAAGARLPMGERLRPGDLLALDYVNSTSLPRPWDHIGVFVEDRGPGGPPDGVLGPEDLFADTGDGLGLKYAPLGDQGVVRVLVLRPPGT